jgi:hypothetical protein
MLSFCGPQNSSSQSKLEVDGYYLEERGEAMPENQKGGCWWAHGGPFLMVLVIMMSIYARLSLKGQLIQ